MSLFDMIVGHIDNNIPSFKKSIIQPITARSRLVLAAIVSNGYPRSQYRSHQRYDPLKSFQSTGTSLTLGSVDNADHKHGISARSIDLGVLSATSGLKVSAGRSVHGFFSRQGSSNLGRTGYPETTCPLSPPLSSQRLCQ